MPHAKHAQRLPTSRPLIFPTRALGPGSAQTFSRKVPAPASIGVEMAWVPEGTELDLEATLEGVSGGVLVTATVHAPLAGECARCLEPFTAELDVSFQELFAREPGGGESYPLGFDTLDLEPALRDSLVLELPLSPLCRADCPGLCPECGMLLAEAGAAHGHPAGQDSRRVHRHAAGQDSGRVHRHAARQHDAAPLDGAPPEDSRRGGAQPPGMLARGDDPPGSPRRRKEC
jgi:uncharacterized protein